LWLGFVFIFNQQAFFNRFNPIALSSKWISLAAIIAYWPRPKNLFITVFMQKIIASFAIVEKYPGL